MPDILYTCRPAGANDDNRQCVIRKKTERRSAFPTTHLPEVLETELFRKNSVSPVPFVLLFDFDDQFDFDGDAAGELDHADRGSCVPAVIAEYIY